MKTRWGWFYTFAFDYYYYHCNWLNFVREQDFFLLLLCFIPAGRRVGSNCYFLPLNESTLCEIRLPWVLASSTFQEVIVPQLWGVGVQSGWSWGCFALWSWYQPKQSTYPGIAGTPRMLNCRWKALPIWSIWKGLGRCALSRLAYPNFNSGPTKIQEVPYIRTFKLWTFKDANPCLRLSNHVRREWRRSWPRVSYCWRPVSSTISYSSPSSSQ